MGIIVTQALMSTGKRGGLWWMGGGNGDVAVGADGPASMSSYDPFETWPDWTRSYSLAGITGPVDYVTCITTNRQIYVLGMRLESKGGAVQEGIAYATDPMNGPWTTVSTPLDAYDIWIYDIKYGNGLWVAIGQDMSYTSRKLIWATDPTGVWTENVSMAGIALNNLCYGNGFWIATTNTGIYYTNDPSAGWTLTSPGVTHIYDIQYGKDGNFVAVGGTAVNPTVALDTTDPSAGWTINTIASVNPLWKVRYGYTYWMGVGQGRVLAYTTDLSLPWTVTIIPAGTYPLANFRLLDYGRDHNWIMGDGSGRWLITSGVPTGPYTLLDLRYLDPMGVRHDLLTSHCIKNLD